jgi:hypothetical protein
VVARCGSTGSRLPDSAAGRGFVVSVVDFQLWKVGLNFTVAGARVHAESGFVRHGQLHISVAAVDLYIS